MRIIENSKSSYLIRLTIYLVLLLVGLALLLYSNAHGSLFIWTIVPIVFAIYYIVSDLIMIKFHKKITPVESKSKRLLRVVILAVTLPILASILSDNSDRVAEWNAFVLSLSIIGVIQAIREDSLVVDNITVERLGFLTGTKMRWSDINRVVRNSERITIQSTRKDYIEIDIKRSTERELRLIDEILARLEIDQKRYAQHNV
jgi:hypothetical protein